MRTNEAASEISDPHFLPVAVAVDEVDEVETDDDGELLVPLDESLDEETVAVVVVEDDAPAPAGGEDLLGGPDPVRMYLQQMGARSLLTREGEVEIATRIEAGDFDMIRATLGSPFGLQWLAEVAASLKAGTTSLRELLRDEVDEDGEASWDEARQRARFLQQLTRIRRLAGEHETLTTRIGTLKKATPALQASLRRVGQRLGETFTTLGLTRRTVDRLTVELRTMGRRLGRLFASSSNELCRRGRGSRSQYFPLLHCLGRCCL